MKIKLDPGAYMPERAHDTDAGLDLRSPVAANILPGRSVTIDTGVHVALPEGTVGMVKSKSGLNRFHGIQAEGVVDEGFTGSICATLYNHSRTTFQVNAGDKITQLVILPVLKPELEPVDHLDETERGSGGFGSTGR